MTPKKEIVILMKVLLLGIVLMGVCIHIPPVQAAIALPEEPRVLVAYSSETREIDEYHQLLNMILGHFTTNISFKNVFELQAKDVENVTHLFYYGGIEEELPPSFRPLFEDFKGTLVALGHNVKQLGSAFSFVEPLAKEQVNEIGLVRDPEKKIIFKSTSVINIDMSDKTEVLIKAGYGEKEYPLFVRNGNVYYYAASDIREKQSIFLAEGLYDVFKKEHTSAHPAYIRLEDIHPLVNPDYMKEIADILKNKNIPYMIAVIPVYTNPETGQQFHFSDSPKLLKVLKYMQDHGGSIVLHGYTHQFRMSETGEGFEFWDVEYNMPIYHAQDAQVVIKTRQDFANQTEYEAYLAKQKAFEREYIKEKVTRGIQELSNYGLYPLAFEAPHYTVSQHGYQVIAEHFSTYVGQLQLSDEDWEIMTTAPYITRPTFLHGMVLLPETIGYIQPENPQSLEQMLQRAHNYQVVRSGLVGGFYHPYLGVEKFSELINELEKIPNLSWIDLKQMDNTVSAEHITIKSQQGRIIVQIDHGRLFMSSLDFLTYHISLWIEKVIWGMAIVGGLAVILFIMNTFSLQIRNNQMGRDQFG